MNRGELIKELKRDEGVVLHAYRDSVGLITIGCGRMVDSQRGGGISMDEAEYLLGNDIDRIVSQLDKRIPWWRQTTESQQRALCNMAFQLGIDGLCKFKLMLKALQAGDGQEAGKQALDSTWANQTPERANRVAGMLAT